MSVSLRQVPSSQISHDESSLKESSNQELQQVISSRTKLQPGESPLSEKDFFRNFFFHDVEAWHCFTPYPS